ncbi:nitroreductase family protein [Pontimonas sp.]|nr:nitroreductase family protein [Pontimonas sp.]MDR9396370.1 nitroreductase family protein [Pontimonas sp.]
MDPSAQTDYPLMPELATRRSPRAFDHDATVTDDQLGSLLEAARWSASSGNSQPWRLFVAKRGTPLFDAVVETLASGNQAWAAYPSALIVNVAKVVTDEGKEEKWAVYDVGQAAAHLSIQATHMGLIVHQMGGFDREALRQVLGVDEGHQPWAVLAVGHHGDPALLPEKLQERENNPRVRKPLDEVAPGWRQ